MTTSDHPGSSESIIAVSVGNTNTAFALCAGANAIDPASLPNADIPAIAAAIDHLAEEHDIDTVVLATVNRTVSDQLARAIGSSLVDVLQINRDIPIPLQHTLEDAAIAATGQDRLLAAVAAYRIAGQACVVVDAGTAITVDFVDGKGTFQGGAIAPGLRMSLRALHEQTDALPEVAFASPDAAIPFARNTTEAMLHGVFYGARGLVRQLAERYAIAYEAYPVIIATGGDAQTIFESEDLIERIVPELTLKGIAMSFAAALEAQD
jgi:type III pantothenate kinase